MIHQLLNLTRPLFVMDTETTGDDTAKDRIVELGFQMWVGDGPCKHCENQQTAFKAGLISLETFQAPCEFCKGAGHVEGGMVKEYLTLVNPGVPIPASASKIHGITDYRVRSCQRCESVASCACPEGFKPVPTFKQLAANLAKGFTDCDWMGQNVRFDLRILAAEFARAGVAWSYAGARIVDSSRLEALAVPRSLSHLHEKYVGLKHDGAHGALSDVRAAATVILKQLVIHDQLPRDLDKLHEMSWPGEIDTEGKFKFINGVACVAFGKWSGKPMASVETSYWDWLCKSEFSAEVKALASAAKLGKYPEAK